ncbi:ATP:ADP antiporter, AAA family [Stigmatella aurantiaca]|uniref:ATP:ADP antiporter, AAA family n=1 Tax=Stigmatella aurantiaca TaxID=41 RepID=A0A1H7XMN0_STIAU|nr:MFS transporter [Stigmatella aurantiaca]SEM34935.1 ATP:ADP antiporter, AAA family [Stigmatella aurantiaca]
MLGRFVDVRKEETGAVLWSFLYFFTLMGGYFILKPLRDAMGTAGGVKQLKWLFTATFGVMLVAVPLFAAMVARWPRRRVIPLIYRLFLLQLLAFFVLMKLEVAPALVARSFYVWVSVYNLFVVSIFWSFMADLFVSEQARRLFGLISAGGTTGVIAGLLLVRVLAVPLGPVNLVLVALVLLEVSVRCVQRLSGWAQDAHSPPSEAGPVGGGILAGLRLLATSPFLLALGLQTVFYTVTSTFLYLLQVRLVDRVALGLAERTAAFANIDLWVQVVTLVLQAFVTARLLSKVGLGVALAVTPVLTLLGFVGLAVLPSVWLFIGVRSLRGATHYALERPSRELLFTTVGREEKYKAKSVIDTVVYRGGDTLATWAEDGLKTLGLGAAGLLLASAPVAGLWLAVSLFLARHPRVRAHTQAPGATALASDVRAL